MGGQQRRKNPLPVVRAAQGHGIFLEAVRKLMSDKSISYKPLKVWQATDYPVSPFLALPRI